jgi:hypothetical protein
MGYHNTQTAARILGVLVPTLQSAIYRGKMSPPQRDEGGRFCWTDADIERARAALANDRRRKPQEVPA